MNFQQPFGAFIALQPFELCAKPPRDSHRMSAPCAKIWRRQQRAAGKRVPHCCNRARANERHVGKRDHETLSISGSSRGAGETCSHALGSAVTHHHLAAFLVQCEGKGVRTRTNHRDNAENFRLEMPRGLHRDRDIVR